MQWTNAREMYGAFEPTIAEALYLTYASSAIELQAAAVNRLADLCDHINTLGTNAVEKKNELDANNAFIMHHIVVGLSQYLWVWIHIKQDEMHAAWDNLIGAQEEFSLTVRLMPDPGWMIHALRNLHALEVIAFPRQQFVSPGVLYEYALCSICGSVCGECDHLTGRLYMGNMCCQIPQNVSHFDHLAFVDYPEDKRCRMSVRGENGRKVCTLTSRDEGEVPPPNEDGTVYGGTHITLVPTVPSAVARAELTEGKYRQQRRAVDEDASIDS